MEPNDELGDDENPFNDLGELGKQLDKIMLDEAYKAVVNMFKAFQAQGLTPLEAAVLTAEMTRSADDGRS